MVRGSNPRWVTKIKGRRNASFLVPLAGCSPPKAPKKAERVVSFYFGDVGRRLRRCSLNKERLLCFPLQQNRSSALNRTHPVGHLPPRYFGGASLAKAPKPSAASFYFGDIVGVRTPQGFGGCALRRRLRRCSLNKERSLCFLLQQNRSSALNRTHPVGRLPPHQNRAQSPFIFVT